MRVYKYELLEGTGLEGQTIQLPEGALIISTQTMNGRIFLWAQVDPMARMIFRRFIVLGTGWDFSGEATYIGTVQRDPFVWHIYEVPEFSK